MDFAPATLSRLMVIFRRVAMTWAPFPVRVVPVSSRKTVSRTHWSRFSISRGPRTKSRSSFGESWPEERLGIQRAVSLRVFPFFLNRVTRSIRKTCSRWGKSEYSLRREETRIVWVSIRPCPEKVILWGGGKSLVVEARDLVFEGLPVVLDREDIIASLLPDPGGQGILGMEGVGGDHLA